MSGETDVIARHEQGDRALSGGTDAAQLAETMERHAPEPAEAAGTGAVPAATEGASAAPAAEPKPTRGQQRFSELAKARDAAQARADAAEARAKELEARVNAPAPAAREPEPARPVAQPAAAPAAPAPAERFSYPSYAQAVEKDANLDYDQWELDRLHAFRDWDRTQQATAAEKAAEAKREAESQQELDTALASWHTRRAAFAASRPDRAPAVQAFLNNVNAGTPLGDALLYSEVGMEMADHLAANLPEATRIAGLNPAQQLLALGRIESTLVAAARPAKRAVAPPPAPYEPVNGNGATVSTSSAELAGKGHDFDASGYREKRAAERKRAGR